MLISGLGARVEALLGLGGAQPHLWMLESRRCNTGRGQATLSSTAGRWRKKEICGHRRIVVDFFIDGVT